MKLGTETGSLINHLIADPRPHLPVIGEDVTECRWTDREAYRVIAVDKDGKGAVLKQYDPKYIGKAYGDETYEYDGPTGEPLLGTYTMYIRYRHNAWRIKGNTGWYKINLAWGEAG